jgi:hypothetical protein
MMGNYGRSSRNKRRPCVSLIWCISAALDPKQIGKVLTETGIMRYREIRTGICVRSRTSGVVPPTTNSQIRE